MHYDRLKAGFSRYVFCGMALACTLPAVAGDISMTERQVYQGMPSFAGVTPIKVDLYNSGPDAKGVLRVTSDQHSTEYPVNLPHGSSQSVVTFPECIDNSNGDVSFDLSTNSDQVHQDMYANVSVGRPRIVADIGRSQTEIDFLGKLQPQNDGIGVPEVAYLQPSEAPERAVGYERLSAIVLSPEASGLSDKAIGAIKTWVLEGGTLIFIGNPSAAPWTSDKRWADLLPVHGIERKTISNATDVLNRDFTLASGLQDEINSLETMGGQPVSGAFSSPGGLEVEKTFGLGRGIYIAFNPFGVQFANSDFRSKMFQEILTPEAYGGSNMALYLGLGRYYGDEPAAAPLQAEDNPFSAQLPAPSTILTVLVAYFLAVVPVNFLVLKKLRRGELAWVTAPLISLAFAGVFFGTARRLYGAGLSTWSNAVLVAQAGQDDGLVVGSSQIFFPNAGRYDLKLSSVDSLSVSAIPGGPYGTPFSAGIEPVDNGEIHADMSVPSLAFRQVTFRQKVHVKDWIEAERLDNGMIKVTNKSPYALENARVVTPNGWVSVGNLDPNVPRVIEPRVVKVPLGEQGNLVHLLKRTNGVAVTGGLEGFRAGPHIGTEVGDSPGINLCYMTNLRLKGSEIKSDTVEGGKR